MSSVLYTRSPTFRSLSSAPKRRGLEPGHELPHPRAVEERDLREVEEDPAAALGEQLVDRLAQDLVAEARGEAALEVEDHDVLRLADFDVHGRASRSYSSCPSARR